MYMKTLKHKYMYIRTSSRNIQQSLQHYLIVDSKRVTGPSMWWNLRQELVIGLMSKSSAKTEPSASKDRRRAKPSAGQTINMFHVKPSDSRNYEEGSQTKPTACDTL